MRQKGLKLKVKKFWRLYPPFVEVTWEKLAAVEGLFWPPILNMVRRLLLGWTFEWFNLTLTVESSMGYFELRRLGTL